MLELQLMHAAEESSMKYGWQVLQAVNEQWRQLGKSTLHKTQALVLFSAKPLTQAVQTVLDWHAEQLPGHLVQVKGE